DHDDTLRRGLQNRAQCRVAGGSIVGAIRHAGLQFGDTPPESADLGLEIVLCRHRVSIIARVRPGRRRWIPLDRYASERTRSGGSYSPASSSQDCADSVREFLSIERRTDITLGPRAALSRRSTISVAPLARAIYQAA